MFNRIANGILVLAAAFVSVACGKSSGGTTQGAIYEYEPRGTIVTTRDGSKFYGDDAAIDVYNYGNPDYKDNVVLVFLAGNGTELWTAQTQVTRDIVPHGSGTADIRQAPLEVGIANVERKRGDYPISRPSSGTFAYSVGDNQRVSVTVDSDADNVAGSVAARFQVRCWVSRNELPRSDGQSSGQTSGGGELALDEQFSTPQCADFRAYGP